MNGEHGIEQICQTDALRFGNQAEECSITVEAPGTALLDNLESAFVVSIKDLVRDTAVGTAVDKR
jgi:hypothetical protein